MHVQSAFQTEIPVFHTEVASSNETPVTSVTSDLYSQKQQKILEQCTLIKMYVRSIDSRLKRIEDGRVKNNNNVYEEVQIIQNIFPLKTTDEITHFDLSLDNKNVTNTFKLPAFHSEIENLGKYYNMLLGLT
ncbi:uncharacterized protein LOC116853106 [Odontomachus brunneus]|uniref:uncharacterized protein LOC116853106 n=1 Tax=Odontomachus brunneus TaxID=486640 RepID=UPI0013F22459|nr:uncharacterized protein LOC116853106 [Odontomachus brunneus]